MHQRRIRVRIAWPRRSPDEPAGGQRVRRQRHRTRGSATGLSTDAGGWFVVGYYVGSAASVTLPVAGQSVNAELTSWSVNPDVKVWWVHGTGVVPASAQPTARDVAGKPLPGGSHSDQLGVG